jgi:hypothetical protein
MNVIRRLKRVHLTVAIRASKPYSSTEARRICLLNLDGQSIKNASSRCVISTTTEIIDFSTTLTMKFSNGAVALCSLSVGANAFSTAGKTFLCNDYNHG